MVVGISHPGVFAWQGPGLQTTVLKVKASIAPKPMTGRKGSIFGPMNIKCRQLTTHLSFHIYKKGGTNSGTLIIHWLAIR